MTGRSRPLGSSLGDEFIGIDYLPVQVVAWKLFVLQLRQRILFCGVLQANRGWIKLNHSIECGQRLAILRSSDEPIRSSSPVIPKTGTAVNVITKNLPC